MAKILNFGSLNLDYIYHVEHFVCAGETLSASAVEKNCGGKGLNQSIAASKAGASVYHAGKIGCDGEMLCDILGQNGVDTRYVKTSDGQNGNAVIQVDKSGQNCILLFAGSNHLITKEEIDNCLDNFGADDYLILQNEINNMPYLMNAAYKRKLKIVFNPSPITEELISYPLETVSLLILNEIEGKALTGKEDADEILSELRRLYPQADVLLTFGKDGAVYYDGNRKIKRGIYRVTPVDTTAAGDTMLGYFVAGLANGIGVDKALENASKASAIAITRMGAAVSIPTADEVNASQLEYLG